jgi:outer membrane immunogenic protein
MKTSLAALATFAAMTAAASAADLPRRAAPPPVFTPVPVFTWSGAYFGVNAGYAYTESDTIRTVGIGTLQNNVNNLLRSPAVRLPQDGFTAGGQVGYNYQFTPGSGIVVGVEADAQYMDLQRTGVQSIFRPAFNPNVLTNTYRTDLSFLGTVRGRVGYAVDRTLFYATGGFAYAGETYRTSLFQLSDQPIFLGNRSRTETGYAVGGGVEYALPTDSVLNVFRSNAVTVKGEALYYDLGGRTIPVLPVGRGASTFATRFQNEGALGRVGVNYKFGSY